MAWLPIVQHVVIKGSTFMVAGYRTTTFGFQVLDEIFTEAAQLTKSPTKKREEGTGKKEKPSPCTIL